jgi:predicted Zn finger-like uncharacterized protein
MSAITQCPTCKTRFKVTPEQLEAHQGLVRCGRCQSVFNATDYLEDNPSSAQLDLPLSSETLENVEGPVEEIAVEIASEPTFTQLNDDLEIEEPPLAEHKVLESQKIDHLDVLMQPTELQKKVEEEDAGTLAQKVSFDENPEPLEVDPVKKKRAGLWLVGSLLLFVILAGQTVYFFRIELAANQPGLKPILLSYCQLLHCSVTLPQKADLMSIESSDLEANPTQPNIISLNVQLRNHATFTQAFPNLELTLTDSQDKPLAIRTFRPVEYLKKDDDEKQGLAGNHELSVKLNLDTTDLKPAGYRLLLFYPQ